MSMGSHHALIQMGNNFCSLTQNWNEMQKQSLPFPNKRPNFIFFCPSCKEPVKSYLQCETKHNALKSANTVQTTKQIGMQFCLFIYSFWPWCHLDQTPGYRHI